MSDDIPLISCLEWRQVGWRLKIQITKISKRSVGEIIRGACFVLKLIGVFLVSLSTVRGENVLLTSQNELAHFRAGDHLRKDAITFDGNTFTIGMWLLLEPGLLKPRPWALLTYGNGWTEGFRLVAYSAPDGFRLGVDIGREKGAWMSSSKPVLEVGKWTSIVCSWNGNELRLLVDGRVCLSKNVQTPLISRPKMKFEMGDVNTYFHFHPFSVVNAFVSNEVLDDDRTVQLLGNAPCADDKALMKARVQRGLSDLGANILTAPTDHALTDFLDEMSFAESRCRDYAEAIRIYEALLAGKRTSMTSKDSKSDRRRSGDLKMELLRVAEQRNSRRTICSTISEPVLCDPSKVNRPANPKGVQVFVSPQGDDSGDGSFEHPFLTLRRARDAVRELRRSEAAAGGIAVYLRGGKYLVNRPLELTEKDSGVKGRPVLWSAWKDEIPVLECGFEIVPTNASCAGVGLAARIPETARPHVSIIDVRSRGFDAFDPECRCGFLTFDCTYRVHPADLYLDGRPLQIARMPNEGWCRVASNVSDGVEFEGKAMAGLHVPNVEGLMAKGYWTHCWADLSVKVSEIDMEHEKLRLEGKVPIKANAPFYLFGVPELIDTPGEWALDRPSGCLCVWMPRSGVLCLSRLAKSCIELNRVTDVEIRGLVLQHGRMSAIHAARCKRITLAGNVIRNFGGDGVRLDNVEDVTVRGNLLRSFGHGALIVSGGDRFKLTPGGNIICHNVIMDTGRRKRTYTPGVLASGCGLSVVQNKFSDMPSSAFRLSGNDHWIASNLVERCVLESDDQGAVDIWGNPTYAGMRFVHNVWRDIGRTDYETWGIFGQAAIRFDNGVSSMLVYGNRFVRCGKKRFGAVQIYGGRRHVIDNNLFEDVGLAISGSEWTDERWKDEFENGAHKHLSNVRLVGSTPYVKRYPGIAMLKDEMAKTYISRNIVVGHATFRSRVRGWQDGVNFRCEADRVKNLKRSGLVNEVPEVGDLHIEDDEFLRMAAKHFNQLKRTQR